jgi:hypothetical protein
MLKRTLTLLGALLILFGLFFALQGANIIHWPPESTMLGHGVWIRNGLIIAALGAVLIAAVRKKHL